MNTTTTTTAFTPKKIEEQRFEFVFYINNNIICQRYFNIRDYNDDVLNSLEIKELMDNIIGLNLGDFGHVGIIPQYLKNKAVDYLWVNFNPYQEQTEIVRTTDKVDNYQFEIKVDKTCVAKGQFSGNLFPPKVRYDVNIKEIIPSIMAEIRDYFSLKNYTILEANSAS